MKHLSVLSFLPLSLLSLISCGSKTYYTSIKQIAPFLHEVVYEDYASDDQHETTDMDAGDMDFGCSSIRNGNLYGRNYDYYYTNSPSFLVKVKRNKDRFQSIGIANSLNINEDDVIELEKQPLNQHLINIVPNFTLDGINENGVIANMNVVDYEDGGAPHTTTNPGAPKLYLYSSVRYILDHAKDAKHAIQLLKSCDLYTLNRHANNIHLMIADPNETYIVELVRENGDENVSIRGLLKKGKDQVMTNFYNNLAKSEIDATYPDDATIPVEKRKYNNNAHGTERYEFIQSRYDDCSSVEGMYNTLNSVRYGIMYNNPDYPDFASEDFTQDEIYRNPEGSASKAFTDYYKEIYEDTNDVLTNHKRDIGRAMDVWITMHSSIYNIEEKTLRLNVQEDYEHTYNYDLNF